MNESILQPEKPKDERRHDLHLVKRGLRCDPDQYNFLKECSRKGEEGIKEWNQWRKEHNGTEILLEGANLTRANLKGVYLNTGPIEDDAGTVQKLSGTVHLKEANLSLARLEGSSFHTALLQGASLKNAHLEDVVLWGADLRGTNVEAATVNGFTSFWKCRVDRHIRNNKGTDFSGVALDNARIDPGTKQLLEYNIRRKNWEEWYKQHKILKWPVWLFWLMSDYGLSTGRIVTVFFGLAFAFAFLYWLPPNTVMVKETGGDIRGLWHALYFSVVTMTTLDFGDIAANPDSWLGQALLMIHVILGYVLLGALVTRFAVLFTAGGPAGKFADEKTMRERLKEWWN